MKKTIVLLWLICVSFNFNLYAKKVDITSKKDFLTSFNPNNSSCNYYVYFMNTDHLNSCVSERANIFSYASMLVDKNAIFIVILEGLEHSEELAIETLKKYFLTSNIIADNKEALKNIFIPRCSSELLVFDNTFNELYRDCGFLGDQQVFKKLMPNNDSSNNSFVKLDGSLSPIITIKSSHFDKKENQLYIIDGLQNKLLIYNTLSGDLLNSFIISKEIENYFTSIYTLDSLLQNMKNYFSKQNLLIPNMKKIIADKKTGDIYLLVEIFKTITSELKNSYQPEMENVLIQILKDKLGQVNEYGKKIGFKKTDRIIIYDNNIIYSVSSNINDSNKTKSPVLMLQNLNKISILAYIEEFTHLTKYKFFPNFYDSHLTCNEMGNLLYIKPKSNLFAKISMTNKNHTINLINKEGILTDIFARNKINNYLSEEYSNKYQIDVPYSISNIFYENNTIWINFQKKDLNEARSNILQAYDGNLFLFENDITYNISNDILLESHILKIYNNKVLLLNKWKRNRWLIQTKSFD